MQHPADTRNTTPPTERSETHRLHHDIEGDDSVAATLAVYLEEETDINLPSDEEVLSDYIDPDALDALFATTDTDNTVQFSFVGHRITVCATGHIYIEAHR